MLPYFTEAYGNPSSIHHKGREAQKALEDARRIVAEILACEPREVVFTGCGTESDNLAIRGTAFAARAQPSHGQARARKARKHVEHPHIITSPVEHHAVVHTCEQLVKDFGCEVTYLPVDETGLVSPAELERAIRPNTALVTIMYANNEVGTIEPIAELAAVARAHDIPFHTDAVQAGGSLDLNVDRLGVDLLSLSAHKFYGPKGAGVLYQRKGVAMLPMQTGGSHERSRRAGTENIPYIVGLAKALELAVSGQAEENARLIRLRDRLIAGVLERIPYTRLTGHPTQRLPNSASFTFEFVEGEGILLLLDSEGICGSSGSACTSATVEPSHVLTAMGVPVEVAHGSLRLTLGRENTDADVDRVLEVLPPIIQRLRDMSPLYPGK
jgi:cysteine desulfurase